MTRSSAQSPRAATSFSRRPDDRPRSRDRPGPALGRRAFTRGGAGLGAATLLAGTGLAGGTAGTAHAAGAEGAGAATAGTGRVAPAPHWADGVCRELSRLVAEQGLPGAQAVITDARGRVTEVAAGAGDLATGRPFPHRARLRVASNTKMFVATVVLQLAAAGRTELEAPVARYLPGVLPETDGSRRVRVRHLLQHTSGLPELPESLSEHTPGYHRPEQVAEISLRQPPRFAPGARWEYCNLGYILLGMVVERVTGRSCEQEVRRRVTARLGLEHTYWPRWPEQRLRGPHPRAYRRTADGGHRPVTFVNTSVIGAAGALVSTGADLTVFLRGLLSGRLLPSGPLARMKDGVPCDIARGAVYGLGLARYPLSGVVGATGYWGHGGTVEGTRTRGGMTDDGRAVLVAVNEVSPRQDGSQAVVDTVERIFRRLPHGGPAKEGER
ncbi:serine hydrolase domain-containing protein [Streptomyces albus]|uniref:serine hydrolase domain-containing protein n=1 Tax=Streptomyces albus TaxID=1888 RepID=UPI003700F1DF